MANSTVTNAGHIDHLHRGEFSVQLVDLRVVVFRAVRFDPAVGLKLGLDTGDKFHQLNRVLEGLLLLGQGIDDSLLLCLLLQQVVHHGRHLGIDRLPGGGSCFKRAQVDIQAVDQVMKHFRL
ncbi:hypothetical protein D3C84_762060 [compost metagenome]